MKFLYAAIGVLETGEDVVITPIAKQTIEEAHQAALDWAANTEENDGFTIAGIRVE